MYLRVEVEDLLARLGVQLGVLLDRGVQALEIAEAELLRDLQHLPLDARHLAQAELVDLLRGEVRGGRAA